MKKFIFPGGSGTKGLLMAGLVAGAFGLALSNQGTYGSQSSGSGAMGRDDTSSQSGQYGGTGSAGGTGMTGAAQLPPNVTPGWKIRVCSEKTKASNINFSITSADKKAAGSTKEQSGTGGSMGSGSMGGTGSASDNSQSSGGSATESTQPSGTEAQTGATGTMSPQTAMWSQGEPTEITLPTELQSSDRIRLEATPGEKNKEASVCVLYNDHVAKKLKFDDKEVSTVKKTETGECGC
ncbi:MAG: hypothetical protein JWO30_2448 [Fibrobacteres bacterium]|nr:hypothetical protein [Fibrobacterota bacterium]